MMGYKKKEKGPGSNRPRKRSILGIKRFLAVKEWCANNGLKVDKYTSNEVLYNFLCDKELPENYRGNPGRAIRRLGKEMLEKRGIFDTRDIQCGRVYFVHDGCGHCKIGFSEDPQKRMKELQIGNPHKLKLIGVIDDLDRIEEAKCHKQWGFLRLEGEWFSIEGNLRNYLKNQFGWDLLKETKL